MDQHQTEKNKDITVNFGRFDELTKEEREAEEKAYQNRVRKQERKKVLRKRFCIVAGIAAILFFFTIYLPLFFQKGFYFYGDFWRENGVESVSKDAVMNGRKIEFSKKAIYQKLHSSEYIEVCKETVEEVQYAIVTWKEDGKDRDFWGTFQPKNEIISAYKENGELLFAGTMQNGILMDHKTGEIYMNIRVSVNGVEEARTEIEKYVDACTLAFEKKVTIRGNATYLFGFFLGLMLLLLDMRYPKALFMWRHMFSVRNPEELEPSDWYMFTQRIGWGIAAIGLIIVLISAI